MTALAELELDAGIRRWISRIDQIAPTLPDLASTDPAVQRVAARELSDLLAAEFTLPIPDGVDLDDITIDGPGGELRMRRYRPSSLSGAAPTQLWLHGGGFYAGTMEEVLNDRLCARRALESGVQHVSLEYRLAPEHPYPAQVDDAIAALTALASEHERFGVDPERLGLGGNSAGAGVSASASLHLRDSPSVRLHHVTLEVPPAALRPVGDSSVEFATGFGLDQMELIASMYVGPEGPADEYASPLDATDLSGLPPHLILVAEFDPLRDAGIAYAARLREAGVPVELVHFAGHLHGSPGLTAEAPGAAWQRRHALELARAYAR